MNSFIKKIIVTILLTCGFTSAYAQKVSNHTLSIANETYIQKVALKEIDRLISKNSIEKSWADKPIISIEKKSFNDSLEWVIKLENKEIKDINKQNIYVFVTLNGVLISSNYTGE